MFTFIPKLSALLISVSLAGAVAASGASCCETGDREAKADETLAKAGSEVADSEQKLFKGYEKLSEALVEDDLDQTRASAGELATLANNAGHERAGEFAAKLKDVENLEEARETLIPLSREIIMLAAGADGYYVMNCPMVENGKWLQGNDEVRNPYMGQRMIACGGVEEEAADLELAPCCEERRDCCDEAGGCCPV